MWPPAPAISHLREPLESPLSGARYDFGSCITKSESTFLAHGGAAGLEHRSLVAHSVPYFLHTCTNFGQWQAATKHAIDLLIDAASPHVDGKALSVATETARSRGTILVLEEVGEEPSLRYTPDPLAPGFGLHLRSGLVCRALLYSQLYGVPQGDLRGVAALGATLIDRGGRDRWCALRGTCHEANLDLQTLFEHYANAEQPLVQYNGAHRQTISSGLLLQCYWALAEIVLLDRVDRAGTRSRLDMLSRHESYAVIQFVLFGLRVLANHYHALMLAPTILAIIEMALDGPLPGSRDYSLPPYPWELIDPPSRFHRICTSISPVDSVVTLRDLDERTTAAFRERRGQASALPFFFDETAFEIPNLQEVITRSLNESKMLGRHAWYVSLSALTAQSIRGGSGGVTDYILRQAMDSAQPDSRGAYAPMLVDKLETPAFFSQFFPDANPTHVAFERARKFLSAQAIGSLKDSFLFDSQPKQNTLLGISDDTLFVRWLRSDRGQFERRCAPWCEHV